MLTAGATKMHQKHLNKVTKLGPGVEGNLSDLRIPKELKVFKGRLP